MSKKIKVSIICITYNQESYVKDCLDGFLKQQTDFDYEILIHDDASSDGTIDILEQYAKTDARIKLFKEKTNQFSSTGTDFLKQLFLDSKGDYIAICEGDDYWTDPLKLQQQYDFMEGHQDYAVCFHPVNVVYQGLEKPSHLYPKETDSRYFIVDNLLKENFIQTNSVMYRKQDYEAMATNVMPNDWYLHLYHAQFGKIGFINRVMSVYRRHNAGIWWQTSAGGDVDEIWKKYGANHLVLYYELLKIYGANKRYRHIIDEHISGTIRILSRLDSVNNTNLIEAYVQKFSDSSKSVFMSLCRTIWITEDTQNQLITKLQSQNAELQLQNDELHTKKTKLQLQNNELLNSLSWKITQPLRRLNKIMNNIIRR